MSTNETVPMVDEAVAGRWKVRGCSHVASVSSEARDQAARRPYQTSANFPYTLAQAFLAVGLDQHTKTPQRLLTATRARPSSSVFTSWLVQLTGCATRSEPGMAGLGSPPGHVRLHRLKPGSSLGRQRW